ncbi:MAG: hypothetical protein JWN38_490 [Candidatus Saccharibacteria bacterium]|nr:hypothetical protein [Candidatus Saccharibacteria bacterium]
MPSWMTKYNPSVFTKRTPLLGLSVTELVIIIALISGSAAAMLSAHQQTPAATSTTRGPSQPITLTPTSSAPAQTPVTSSQPVTPTPAPAHSSTPPTKPTTTASSCTNTEATYAQTYNNTLSAAWITWSKATYLTPSEMNFKYNQSAQYDYGLFSQAIEAAGCTSHLSLALKSPATDPTTDPVNTPTTPACNTSLQASYQNSYQQQYQSLLEQESTEVRSVQAQMAAAGAGFSSAYNAVPSEVAQQYSSKFGAIKSTLNSELISIHCPTS